jgi:DNA-binding transcriptional ArsR family regulator
VPRLKKPSLEEVDAVFLALAHEARRHVVLLLAHSGGELPSGYLAARFQHSWPTTTRHLKVLEEAGLVEVRREGRTSNYRLNRDRLQHVVGDWLRHLEPVGPEKKWPATGPRSTRELSRRAEENTKGKQR